MEFEYYYGKEAEQFSFIRIPKILLTHEVFRSLSIQAKVLFGVLLDRMSLSMKNGWLDSEGRVYIIYQIQEIQEDLGFSRKKAMDHLGELEKIGLVEKKRRGLGLPSILYVKSFMTGVVAEATLGTSRSSEIGTSLIADRAKTVRKEDAIAVVGEGEAEENLQKKEKTGKIIFRNADLRTSGSIEKETSRSANIEPQEVPEIAPLNNNTKTNNTYENNILSNPIVSSGDSMRLDQSTTSAYRALIKENIEYDVLCDMFPHDHELLDGIVEIMLEVALNQNQTILIASATYPTELVRGRFLKLNSEHVQYAIECFNSNTTRVGNIKKYLMTVLFNAPSTISGYYTAAVHHDMPYLVAK